MGGMLAALVVGGLVIDRFMAPSGVTGSLQEVMPAAAKRALAWDPEAALIQVKGRELEDGRSGGRGGWEFTYRAPKSHPGKVAHVILADHILTLREGPDTGGTELFPANLQDSSAVALRARKYGLKKGTKAEFILENALVSEPATESLVFCIRTEGKLAATWLVDARSGDLLSFEPTNRVSH